MPRQINATIAHLAAAVRHRDDFPLRVADANADVIIRGTMKTLALCALGRAVKVDLGNGHRLCVTVEPGAVTGGAPTAAPPSALTLRRRHEAAHAGLVDAMQVLLDSLAYGSIAVSVAETKARAALAVVRGLS